MEYGSTDAGLNSRRERIVVETVRHRIVGDVTIRDRGLGRRLSDFLNGLDNDFLALTEATCTPLAPDGRVSEPLERPFVSVARKHIVVVAPAG